MENKEEMEKQKEDNIRREIRKVNLDIVEVRKDVSDINDRNIELNQQIQ